MLGRAVVEACLPWAALLVVLAVAARALVRLEQGRFNWRRLRELHADEGGSAQSLSFVLTLPVFIMVILLIVQVSQIMIGTVVVHYSAFAAARSAVVWIPAGLSDAEPENCISAYYLDPEASDQRFPMLNPDAADYGPAEGGVTLVVVPGSPKFEKIRSAAVVACMPISPSRSLGRALPGSAATGADILQRLYAAMVPASTTNSRVPARIENKLAYALANTEMELRFFHKNSEPPLVPYYIGPDTAQFRGNELGFQDQLTVTVFHDMALLPGPGRLLARSQPKPGQADEVAAGIQREDGVYKWRLTASATMSLEGEKSVLPYSYYAY